MTDLILWSSLAFVIALFAVVIWIGRRNVRGLAFRTGQDSGTAELAAELRRMNGILETLLDDHETRLSMLEATSGSSETDAATRDVATRNDREEERRDDR